MQCIKPGSVCPLFSLHFLSVSIVLLTRAPFCVVICVFYHLVVFVRLSVLVQVIDWKESTPK